MWAAQPFYLKAQGCFSTANYSVDCQTQLTEGPIPKEIRELSPDYLDSAGWGSWPWPGVAVQEEEVVMHIDQSHSLAGWDLLWGWALSCWALIALAVPHMKYAWGQKVGLRRTL